MEFKKLLVVFHMNLTIQILSVLFTVFSKTVSAWLFTRGSKPLVIDGGWSAWTNWSLCHHNIEANTDFYKPWKGFLVASKERYCNSPKPINGGRYCLGNQYRYKQCGCQNPLGLENGRVRDGQLSASSESEGFPASYGRLRSKFAWCAAVSASSFNDSYFKVQFNRFTRITEITTEGIQGRMVSRYQITYNIGINQPWMPYSVTGRKPAVIQPTFLRRGVKTVKLKNPIIVWSLRLHPVRSIGRVCMKTEVCGCEFTCGKLLTASSGDIVGKSSADIDQDCLWRLKVPNATRINLYFKLFNLPCKNGNLEVRDASIPFSDSAVKQRFCNDNEAGPHSFYGSDLWIRFRSNTHLDEIGFSLRYVAACERNIELPPKGSYVIVSPNFSDNHTYDCKWKIATVRQSIMQIEFLDFDIQQDSVNMTCESNFLAIEERNMQTQRYCNIRRPNRHFLINGSEVTVSFKIDKPVYSSRFKIRVLSLMKDNELEDVMTPLAKTSPASPNHASITRTEQCTSSMDWDRVASGVSEETPDKLTVIIIVVSCVIVVSLIILVIIGGKNIYNVHVQETFRPVGNWDIKHVMVKKR